ncbi:MAG: D-glycero-D-manno-heptose 1,7-bisphosphate phosphatase, partial [Bacteroidota bacterium]|nr:D-glycero-D-manno-heptose 1,7-bisphosphate phosphatase [Bacteroidota bacterium]
MNKAFFFDRDGIVNHRIIGDYVKNINEFRFKDEFFQIFETVKSQGYLAILVTNQQGIGKGLMTEEDLRSV